MKFLEIILYPIRLIFIGLIYLYRYLISPMFGRTCRYYPSCSKYMLRSIREWGVVKGVWLGIKRILRCRPKCECGEDFVPLNIKGELKWTY